jgi:hypothetical protein
MKRLLIHAGLHKTGTTSFQNYLLHKLDLSSKIIIYPKTNDDFESHCGILSSRGIAGFAEWVAARAVSDKTIAVSCEEITQKYGSAEDTEVDDAFGILAAAYDTINVVLTMRSERDFLKSMAREHIEGSGFSIYGLGGIFHNYYQNLYKFISALKRNEVNFATIEMEGRPAGMSLESYYCERILCLSGVECDVKTLNVTAHKPITSIFASQLRVLASSCFGAEYYSGRVNRFIAETLQSLSFTNETGKVIGELVDGYLDREVAAFVDARPKALSEIIRSTSPLL